MELLERYVQAVGRYLPEARRTDILAKLGEDLREEMDDRAEGQGRPLNEEEQAEVLRRYGHPVAVAAQYGSAPPLIGPEIAPFYWFTLRRVTPFVAALVAFSQVVVWLNVPATSNRLLAMAGTVVQGVFSFWSVTTLVFALVDWIRRRRPHAFAQPWDPRKLPQLRKLHREGLPTYPVTDLVFSVLFLLWLLAFPRFPEVLLGPAGWAMLGFGLDLAPVWPTFYWLVVGFNCVQIVFKMVSLGDVGLELRRGLKVVEHALSLGMLVFLLRAPSYLVMRPGQAAVSDPRMLALWNAGVHQALVLVAAIVAIKLVWYAVRLISGRVQGVSVRSPAR